MGRLKKEVLRIYGPLVEKHTKLNNIEMPSEDDDDYLQDLYSFVWDAKFIDFAYAESGKIFNENMFTIEVTDEDMEELRRRGIIKDPDNGKDKDGVVKK
jgi:hypothetical protein